MFNYCTRVVIARGTVRSQKNVSELCARRERRGAFMHVQRLLQLYCYVMVMLQ